MKHQGNSQLHGVSPVMAARQRLAANRDNSLVTTWNLVKRDMSIWWTRCRFVVIPASPGLRFGLA